MAITKNTRSAIRPHSVMLVLAAFGHILVTGGYGVKRLNFESKAYAMVYMLNKGATKTQIALINKKLGNIAPQKKLDAKKYCGVIKLREDPLFIQKKLRDEWE